MGFLNKVKNLFFEEEIVEIEEKPKKVVKEAPVAKKIELPKNEIKEEQKEIVESYETIEEKEPFNEPMENKFLMSFDDDDFKTETVPPKEEVEEQVSLRRSERHRSNNFDEIDEVETVYEEEKIERSSKYDLDSESHYESEVETHAPYEGKPNKKGFTPTPIISPIYGILDKNYKKDDVVTKKEIRLSSAPKKIDLDSVREKAYGDLTNDISQSMTSSRRKQYDDEMVDVMDDDNLLYDLNEEDASPAVKKVTVGDAEEYYNDLGLEYNIDYKDKSVDSVKPTKERTRRSEAKESYQEEPQDDDSTIETEDTTNDEDLTGSNLFDLIESTLYDEKE